MQQRSKDCNHNISQDHEVRGDGYVGTPCPICYDRGLMSDLYKDEYGFRPSDLSTWSDLDVARWLRWFMSREQERQS